jgi:hypothetical protein
MWYLENKFAFRFFSLFVRLFGTELEKLDLEIFEKEEELLNGKKLYFLYVDMYKYKRFHTISEEEIKEGLEYYPTGRARCEEYLDMLRARRNLVLTHVVAAQTQQFCNRF